MSAILFVSAHLYFFACQDAPTVELPPEQSQVKGRKIGGKILPPEKPLAKKLASRETGSMPGAGTMVFWTFFILALMGGAFVLLKRYVGKSHYLGAGAIQVLARKSLSQRHQVFLVEVGSKIFLMGTTRDRIVSLGEFTGPEEVATLRTLGQKQKEDSIQDSFRARLKEGLSEGETRSPERELTDSLFDELKEMKKTVLSWKA